MSLHQLTSVFQNLTPLDRENILKALNISMRGILAVFLAIGIIIAVTYIMRYCIIQAQQLKQKRNGGRKKTPPSGNDER